MLKRKLIFCRCALKRKAVRHEVRNGIEHIIVQSATLPDNVVMNGGLYPAEEIAKSYKGLERTLAPLEHPIDADGNFLSASDPEAINNFHVGAWNMNVRRDNGRVFHDIVINVPEALKRDRGRRLLDRIAELETNEDARPIHTSVGLWCEVAPIPESRTNEAGDSYTWIARNMEFDHNAILLDTNGAATPEKGVGMAVNHAGQHIEVEVATFETNAMKPARNFPLAESGRTWDSAAAVKRVREHLGLEDVPTAAYGRYFLWYDAENSENFGAYKLPFVDIIDGEPHAVPAALRNAAARLGQTQGPSGAEKERIRGIIDSYLSELTTNQDGSISVTDLYKIIREALERSAIEEPDWIEEIYADEVILGMDDKYYRVPYRLDGDRATIVGIPEQVERKVTYQPITNQRGNEAMKDLILNALKDAGIEVEGLNDEQLFAEYNKLQANQSTDDGQGGTGDTSEIAEAVTNAVKPLTDKIDALEAQLNSQTETERAGYIELITNSDKYPGMDGDGLAKLSMDKLREMASHCGRSFGLPLTSNMQNSGDEAFQPPADMPE